MNKSDEVDKKVTKSSEWKSSREWEIMTAEYRKKREWNLMKEW